MSDAITDRITATIREVVNERPDYVYEKIRTGPMTATCRYVENSEPSCLIGVVLHRLGVPLHVLVTNNEEACSNAGFQVSVEAAFGDTIPHRTWNALHEAQEAQDSGDPWSEALATYERYLDLVS